MALPTDAKDRKGLPMFTGVLAYFPDALAEVARVSRIGNDQHNPGQPLQWSRGKSTDQLDCAIRHMVDHLSAPVDTDGGYHLAKAAWRLLAELQLVLEAQANATPVAEPAPGTPEWYTSQGLWVPAGIVPVSGSSIEVRLPREVKIGTSFLDDRTDAQRAMAAGPIGRRPKTFEDYEGF